MKSNILKSAGCTGGGSLVHNRPRSGLFCMLLLSSANADFGDQRAIFDATVHGQSAVPLALVAGEHQKFKKEQQNISKHYSIWHGHFGQNTP